MSEYSCYLITITMHEGERIYKIAVKSKILDPEKLEYWAEPENKAYIHDLLQLIPGDKIVGVEPISEVEVIE